MTKTHEFIEFRRHVESLVRDGSLKSRADILIYAIKERQRREIIFRIPNTLVSADRYADPAYLIFGAEGILNADDYAYFFEAMDADSYRAMLAHLSSFGIGEEFYNDHSRHWLKEFFIESLKSAGEHSCIGSSDMSRRLIDLLLNVYKNAEEASPIYKGIVEKFAKKDETNTVFYSNILSIVDTIKSANSYNTTTEEYYQSLLDHEGLVNSCREHLPEKKVCIAELFKAYGLAYWGLKSKLRDEYEISPEQKTIFESRMLHLHERVQHYAVKMNDILGMGVNSALELYGNRNTKQGGSMIPAKMEISISVLKVIDIDEALRTEIATRMLVKLLNGSLKLIDKTEVHKQTQNLASMVDWAAAFSTLNEQGKHQVIASKVDSSLYLNHLTESKDRLLVLHQDLGM